MIALLFSNCCLSEIVLRLREGNFSSCAVYSDADENPVISDVRRILKVVPCAICLNSMSFLSICLMLLVPFSVCTKPEVLNGC